MIQTAEKIYDEIRVLPKEERTKLDRLLSGDSKNGDSNGARVYRNDEFQDSLRWVEENRDQYIGQFVLLVGDQLIGHDTDPKKLYALADERGIKLPFVKRIIADNEPFFGGW